MLRIVLIFAIATLSLSAEAQSYRCVGKDGKKYYGQSVPPQCAGLPMEQLNAQGVVVKKIDPQATADELARKYAEDAERKKRESVSKDENRRDRALLATYSSEGDVESARGRALEGNQLQIQEIEAKIAALRKRRAAPSEDAGSIDAELKIQDGLLALKRKEADSINARYGDDRKRYVELTRKGK